MADLIAIQRDVQETVRRARFAQDTIKKLELDTITYKVKDKDGNTWQSFEGRDKSEIAQKQAGHRDKEFPKLAPHYVEAVSNIDVPEDSRFLDFVDGAKNEIEFPLEEIRNKLRNIENSIDCETITSVIKDEVKSMIDLLKEEISDMGILGGKADLTKVPSDPMKIVSWAKKFVTKYLAPNLLATVELAILIAQMVSLVQDVIIAANAARQNLLLCAESVVDDLIDDALGGLSDVVKTAVPALDSALGKIGSIQNELSNITGTPPIFDVSSVDGLIESATVERRAAFQTDMNNFLLAPLETSELSSDTVNSVGTSLSGDTGFKAAISGDSTFASDTLASAGAVAAEQSFTVDGTTFTFTNGVLTAVA